MNTTTPVDLQNLKGSALCLAFPRPTPEEKSRMKESIQKIGLLEDIVLHEGEILDGLSRYECCTELGATATFRQWGSRPSDGTSPTDFVTAKNLAHRFLTTGQKATIAESLVPFYQAEANITRTAAVAVAAQTVNVAPSTVHQVATLKKNDPTGFAKVAAGTTTPAAATAESKEAEQRRLEALEEKELEPIRQANAAVLTKRLGEAFGTAFENGVILKTKTHMENFLAMDKEDQKFILPLVLKQWEPKTALKFMQRILDGESRLKDLVLQTAAMGKTIKVLVDGYVVTARKAAEGESV